MNTDAAPKREMQFVMKEIGGLDSVLAQCGFEDVTPDVVDSTLDEAAKFARQAVGPAR